MIHRHRIAATLAAVGLLFAPLVGLGGLATASAGNTAHTAQKHPKKKPAPVKKRGCIPQTSHHTDSDPDNHGGPNDGDGCV